MFPGSIFKETVVIEDECLSFEIVIAGALELPAFPIPLSPNYNRQRKQKCLSFGLIFVAKLWLSKESEKWPSFQRSCDEIVLCFPFTEKDWEIKVCVL